MHMHTVILSFITAVSKPQDCPQTTPTCPKEPPAPLCLNVLANCSKCQQLVNEQAFACESVLAWDGNGDPPVCPSECMNATYAIGALPNVKELACCDCGEGAPGMECNMRKMKIGAACGNTINCKMVRLSTFTAVLRKVLFLQNSCHC